MISNIFKNIKYKNKLTYFSVLKNTQSFSNQEKKDWQLEKLKNLLKSAQKTKYYSNILLDYNIDELTFEKFIGLPLLDKNIIRVENQNLLNQEFIQNNKVYKTTSGGSTGSPVEFVFDKEQTQKRLANALYYNYLNGVSPFANEAILWGAVRDMHTATNKSFLSRAKEYLNKHKFYNTFVLNDKIIDQYLNELNSQKPDYIKAYVHSIYNISKYINSKGIKINFTPVIQTTTGPLFEEARLEIQKAFNNAHIFNFYGSRESGPIASEIIGETGMTVAFDNVLLEVLDKDGNHVKNGEKGEIVITGLYTHAMPLIRYRIGDLAIKGDDENISTLKLENVTGRTLGVIHKKNGDTIDGQFFTTLFFGTKGIKNFQLVQEDYDNLTLNIVKSEDFLEAEIDEIISKIISETGIESIQINYTEKINLNQTGKLMYVFSRLDLENSYS